MFQHDVGHHVLTGLELTSDPELSDPHADIWPDHCIPHFTSRVSDLEQKEL